MTVSDKLAFSINGTHAFFDTPPNPRKPGHGPGGSSGGSASAVALGLVDFALGPDVRAPSSYCGVFGFRTSTGIVDPAGMLPLAPSFDAAGWFAADAAMLARVGEAMLPAPTAAPAPVSTAAPRLEHLIVATDALEAVQPGVAAALEEQLPALAQRFGTVERIRLAEEGLEEWAARFAVIQAAEAWRFNGAWIQEHGARLSPDVRARFERGIAVTDAEESSAREAMARIAARLDGLLGDDGVLLIPTAPFPPPPLGVPSAELEPYRPRMLQLTSISGLGGIPQLCLPLLTVDGPVGVSLLARRGSDAALLELGVRVCPAS